MKKLSLFDTTLRDGEQAPGNALTKAQKVAMACRLEELGVDIIEAGFPLASEVDFQAAQDIAKAVRCRLSAFSRSTGRDIEASVDALAAARSAQIQLLAVGSDIHLAHKRQMTRQAAIEEAVEAIKLVRALGVTDVSLGIEDASRGDRDYLRELTLRTIDHGATTIVVADTVGSLLPVEAADLIRFFRGIVPAGVVLSGHFHDDMGLALANALAAVHAGCDEIQVTIGGIGERAGNTPLEELATVLAYKQDFYQVETGIDLTRLCAAAEQLFDFIGKPIPTNKAILGKSVFATQAGIHQDGLLKNPETYEYVRPERFGRAREIVLGRHSGRSVIHHVLQQHKLPYSREHIDRIYRHIVELSVPPESFHDYVLSRYRELHER